MLYKFDIFSNIHYGYIGRAAGISKDELLDGAGLAQAIKDENWKGIAENVSSFRKLDYPTDQETIKLGIALWETYKENLTKKILLQKIRDKIASWCGAINKKAYHQRATHYDSRTYQF